MGGPWVDRRLGWGWLQPRNQGRKRKILFSYFPTSNATLANTPSAAATSNISPNVTSMAIPNVTLICTATVDPAATISIVAATVSIVGVKPNKGKKPTEVDDTKWGDMKLRAASTIRLALAPKIKYDVLEEDNPKNLWEKLTKTYHFGQQAVSQERFVWAQDGRRWRFKRSSESF
ncbi:hypothetical protein AgCh_008486 [Apium graveolens]